MIFNVKLKKKTALIILFTFILTLFNFPKSPIRVEAASYSPYTPLKSLSFKQLGFKVKESVIDEVNPVLYLMDGENKRIIAYNYETQLSSILQLQLQPEKMCIYNGKLYVTLLKGAHNSYNFGEQAGAFAIIDTGTFAGSSPCVTKQVDIDMDPYSVTVGGDGIVYISGGSAQWTPMLSYNPATGVIKNNKSMVSELTDIVINRKYNKIYSGTIGTSFNIFFTYLLNDGQVVSRYTSDNSGKHPSSAPIEISPDGGLLFTAGGGIFTSSDVKVEDMKYVTTINGVNKDIEFDVDKNTFYTLTGNNTIEAYNYKSYELMGIFGLSGPKQRLFLRNNKFITIGSDSYNVYNVEVYESIIPAKKLNVTGSSIADNTINLNVVNNLSIQFDDNVQLLSSMGITLTDEENRSIPIVASVSDNKLNIDFNNGITYGKYYTLKITGDGLKGMNGTVLYSDIVIRFATSITSTASQNKKEVMMDYKVLDSSRTIEGDLVIAYGATTTIQNTASLTVNGDVIVYGSLINYGQLNVRGSIYAVNSSRINEIPSGYVNGRSYLDGGTTLCSGGISKSYPVPYLAVLNEKTTGLTDTTFKVKVVSYPLNSVYINKASYSMNDTLYKELTYSRNVYEQNVNVKANDSLNDSASYSFSFDTSNSPYLKIVAYSPAWLERSEIAVNSYIGFKFDKSIKSGPGSNNVSLKKSDGTPVGFSWNIEKDENGNPTILHIEPFSDLEYSRTYTLTIPRDAVTTDIGEVMASDYIVTFKTDPEFMRLAGKDRYETTIQISKSGWESADNVILATGLTFPDALSAAPLARKLMAPILLTDPKNIPQSVIDEIVRLKAKNIYIIGGEGAVSKTIEDRLKSMSLNCRRISGPDRYQTAVAIAKELGTDGRIIVATGENFPDALSIAPFAAYHQIPIILTRRDALPDSVKQYIAQNNIKTSLIIGGEGVVSKSVELNLPQPVRIAGTNRYDTNFKIAEAMGADATYTYFATGQNFPDALTGAAYACYTYSPIILLDPGMDKNIIEEWKYNKGVMKTKIIIGGTGVVKPETIKAILGNVQVP